jgi:hypothetical protein
MVDNPILRLNYTNRPQPFERFSLDEWQELNPNVCPCCRTPVTATRIERDVVGGKYLAYVIHPCNSCGWWNTFKFWEDRTGDKIHACQRSQPVLEEFNIADRRADIEVVLRLLKRNFELLREVHHEVFEKLIQRLLSEQGHRVVDISHKRSSGGDILAIDLDGKRILVEVKHYNYDPVGIDIVWKLKGALQDYRKDYEGGLIVTSNRFTKDALESMSRELIENSSCADDIKIVSGIDLFDLAQWLALVELRPSTQVFDRLKYFIDDDAMSEM